MRFSEHISLPAIYAVLCLLCISCESDKMVTVSNQEEAISKYADQTMADYAKFYTDNTVRIVMRPGEADNAIEYGDRVSAVVEGHIFSNGPGAAFCSDTLEFAAGSGRFVQGLDEGLIGACKGELAYIAFSAKYGFYDETVGSVPPMSPLLYIVEILDINNPL